MTNILVSGAAGFIASHIAKGLLEQGHRVIGVDNMSGGTYENLPNMRRNSNFTFYEMDLCDPNMFEVFAAHRPEVVYHCAASAREGASPFQPFHITRTNITASVHTIELGIRYGMRKLVFLSSMSIYGNQKPPFHEKMKRQPVDPYGVNKSAIEQIIEQLSEVHGFEYIIIRLHNVIGRHQSLTDRFRNVAAIFMNSIMRKEPLYIYGNGHRRAFSNIKDSLPCFLKAAEIGVAAQEIINVGGKEVVAVDDLAAEVIKQFPEYPVPEIIHLPSRPLEVETAYCTTEKSEQLLGYQETYGWKEAIRDMAEWAKAQGPKEWTQERLPLGGGKLPVPWRAAWSGLS